MGGGGGGKGARCAAQTAVLGGWVQGAPRLGLSRDSPAATPLSGLNRPPIPS